MTADLPAAGQTAELLLPGPAGELEAIIAMPAQLAATPGFAVVCHPHPLYGGAMTNKVAYALAASALKCGLAAARFNFRGVGRSQGAHDQGRGETEDALAVVGWMRERMPGAGLLLAGFSFGAFVSLKASVRAKPKLQISIAPPFKYFDGEPRPPRPDAPWLVVHGQDDEVVNYADTCAELEHYSPPPDLVTLQGAGHFFHGRLTDLQQVLTTYVGQHWPHG